MFLLCSTPVKKHSTNKEKNSLLKSKIFCMTEKAKFTDNSGPNEKFIRSLKANQLDGDLRCDDFNSIRSSMSYKPFEYVSENEQGEIT